MSKRMRPTTRRKLETAVRLHQDGRLVDALTLYDEVLESYPQSSDALHFRGVLHHQTGDSHAAVELIRQSLAINPDHPDAINNLGNVLRESGRFEEATDCYRKVLELAPDHVDTLVNMAIVQNGLQEPDLAMDYLHRAMAVDDQHPALWHNLGGAYRRARKYDQALAAYQRSLELDPDNDQASKAVAKLLFAMGKPRGAIEELTRLLERSPEDAIARHLIAAFGGSDVPDRASDLFVTQIFDEFAAHFDESLARLDYKAPQLVADKLSELAATAGDKWDILDIGCGTGLCGPLVKRWAKRLVGVDLSRGMLRKANLLDVYDELHQEELTAFMRQSQETYDAIICVDTLVYFGELDEAFLAASTVMNTRGYLVFTVESHADDGASRYRLQHHGRYSHSAAYIRDSLENTGFTAESIRSIVPRNEAGEPVEGSLVVARLAS